MSLLPPPSHLLWAALGGALGSSLRLSVSWAFQHSQRLAGLSPYAGTLAVNIFGCLAIGWLLGGPTMVDADGSRSITSTLTEGSGARTFLVVGVLGGLTTFSAFGYETLTLFDEGQPSRALLLVGCNLIFGVVAVIVGSKLA